MTERTGKPHVRESTEKAGVQNELQRRGKSASSESWERRGFS